MLSLTQPTTFQTPEEQLAATQKALQDIQGAHNNLATSPAVIVHLPSTTDGTIHATTSTTAVEIPGYSWTFNCRGGLVCVEASLNGSISNSAQISTINLLVDGKIVLTSHAPGLVTGPAAAIAWSITQHWKQVLGKGQHTISFTYVTNAGIFRVNGVAGTDQGFCSSAVSIIEFPTNVQNLDVNAA